MAQRLTTALLFGALLPTIALATQSNAVESIPVEDFTRIDMVAPAISPDGKHVVYLTHSPGKKTVAILDVATRKSRALMPADAENDFSIDRCWFKNEERLICHYRAAEFGYGDPFYSTR
ncbi:MAG: hypothetical protein RML32_11145, partial [Gammaproteobacteria bacterium]|nr:hypothetical protein [Gammaproteobacteria bacterium]